ncbi:MAG: 50S ribosomal protein L6 [Epsilonproteobacteria bacterium]|nr:MAG: 50S ribosomal protein L6 [Campylobacterota bacterium]
MSRVGKKIIDIPSGIEISEKDGIIIVKKSNKTIEVDTKSRVKATLDKASLSFERVGDDAQSSAYWGTYRSLVANAIEGLHKGYEKSLEINGVGYRAAVKGKTLELQLGYSHPINFEIPQDIMITIEKNIINIKGISKQEVGQTAAIIRAYRKPEPYKGKGVKYVDEHIVRKAGKTAS